MNEKQKSAWDAVKNWLERFDNDEHPYEGVPAADLLTLMWEAENSVDKPE